MSTATAVREPGFAIHRKAAQSRALRVLGAALALGIAYIHVKDQGGIPGDKGPGYIALGYWMLEIVGVGTAVALLLSSGRTAAKAWLLSIGVALGPICGYVLSRGPGLPNYTDDKGVWTEQLGVIALVVESALLVLAATMWSRSRRDVEIDSDGVYDAHNGTAGNRTPVEPGKAYAITGKD